MFAKIKFTERSNHEINVRWIYMWQLQIEKGKHSIYNWLNLISSFFNNSSQKLVVQSYVVDRLELVSLIL